MNKQLDPQYIDAVQELRDVKPQPVTISSNKPPHWFIGSNKTNEPETAAHPTIEQAWDEYLKAQPVDIEKVKPKTD